jgi:DNA polymerase
MATGNEQTLRARARLALRAEKAFGLSALPRRFPSVDAIAAEVASASPVSVEIAMPKQVSCKPPAVSVDLFGKPVVASKASTSVPLPVTVTHGNFDSPVLSRDEKIRALAELNANEVQNCNRCRLHEKRTNSVFGEGDPDAKILFIGEGPGENEDLQGRPFVGRAGEKLNQMIAAMGLRREQVYIANIVKCRPPGNREPAPDEVATCTPILERQIQIIRPRVIVTLGRPALQHMLQQKISISRMRGQWQNWRGIRLMPTFHPAYILRNYTEETRAAVWSDLQQVLAELGMKIPSRKSSS